MSTGNWMTSVLGLIVEISCAMVERSDCEVSRAVRMRVETLAWA